MRKFFFCTVLCILAGCAQQPVQEKAEPVVSPQEPKRIYTPAQLKTDLAFLKRKLLEVHPEPFLRLSEVDFEVLYDATRRQLNWSQGREQFYQTVAPLVAQLSDAHTRLEYPEKEHQAYLSRVGKLPLALLHTSEGMVVVADVSRQSKIPTGSILISINEQPMEELLARVSRYVPGETEAGQIRMMQMELSRLYWSEFPDNDSYRVKYRWRGKTYEQNLDGLIIKSEPNAAKSNRSHYGSLRVDDTSALLWLNDFNEDYDAFEDYLSTLFSKLNDSGVEKLIVDLRYNSGGVTDNLSLLLSYFIEQEIHWAESARLKVSQPFLEHQSDLLSSTKEAKYGSYFGWLPVEFLNTWRWELLFTSVGEIITREIDVVEPRDDRFKGQLVVLVNGYCYSACASFVASVKTHELGLVIGETPGSRTRHQFGFPVEIELPNTKLSLIIPAMQFSHTARAEEFDKVPVDISMKRGRIDVLLGRDPLIEKAIQFSRIEPIEE